jgi:hypothetical protein
MAPVGDRVCPAAGFVGLRAYTFRVSFLAHVVEVLLVVAVLFLLGALATFVLLRRRARRRWNRWQAHPATRSVLAATALVASWRERRTGDRDAPAAFGRGTAARARRRLSVALRDAEEAVGYASSRQAPVGELPAVCRTLRRVGDELDGLLRLQGRLPLRRQRIDAIGAQVREVVDAAHDIQAAALRACSDANEPRLRALVRDVRDEVDIVAAGLARLRSVTPR